MMNNVIGMLMVTAQFGILAAQAALCLLAPLPTDGYVSYALWAVSAALGLWAVAANPPGNFNIRPMPKAGGHLVCSGPYRWVRHPMYTAVMLFSAACAWYTPMVLDWALMLALVAVLWAKASLEEGMMCAQHAGYAEYMTQTRRFVPWVV